MTARKLAAGDVVRLDRAASPQFVRPILVRVIREIPERHTYDGWLWFEGYELAATGGAVAKRELYAMRAGLRWVDAPAVRRPVRVAR